MAKLCGAVPLVCRCLTLESMETIFTFIPKTARARRIILSPMNSACRALSIGVLFRYTFHRESLSSYSYLGYYKRYRESDYTTRCTVNCLPNLALDIFHRTHHFREKRQKPSEGTPCIYRWIRNDTRILTV